MKRGRLSGMRKLAWFAGGFGAACLFSCLVADGIFPAIVSGAVFLIAMGVFLLTRPQNFPIHLLPPARKALFHLCRRGAAFFLGCTLAFLWFTAYSSLFRAPAEELAGTEQDISGTVTSYPQETSIGGYSVILRLDGGFDAPDILLYGNEDWGDLRPGDRITCGARLKSSDTLYGDETTYYTARGLFLLGYCDDAPAVEKADRIPLRYWAALCADALRDGIYAAFDEVAAPLAAAVTLGDKSGLSEQTYSALNRSGIMHAAVVSGMHVSFLSALLLILCGGRQRVALALVPVLFFYALMAGGTPSAFRAVIMQTALLAGPILDRENDGPTSLGLALLILLIQNPCAAGSVSLQLSFGSVAGIMLVSQRLTERLFTPVKARLDGGGRLARGALAVWRPVSAGIAVSLGAMLFTVPLISLYFGRIPLISPLTNILTIWAVTILMISALAVGTLGIFFPVLAAIPGFIAGLAAHYIQTVTAFIGRLPMATLDGRNLYFIVWLVSVYLLILTAVVTRRRWQGLICTGLAAVLLVCAFSLNRLTVRRADLTVTALNVGQGASTLILSGSQAVLVDCGGNGADSAGDIAADRLTSLGRSTLDALILTHLDDDHFNGVAQLFWRLNVKEVFLSDSGKNPEQLTQLLALAEREGAAVSFVTETTTFSAGGSVLTIFPPLSRGTSNEAGLFVLCSHGDFDALITGDADAFVEKMLLKYRPIPDLELLMVGHHGSKHSTCAELLEGLRPELAVISVGYNSYGHPADETLERLTASGTQTFRTDLFGTVTVKLKDQRIYIH